MCNSLCAKIPCCSVKLIFALPLGIINPHVTLKTKIWEGHTECNDESLNCAKYLVSNAFGGMNAFVKFV